MMYRPFLLFYLLHGCWSTRPPPNKLIGIKTNCTKDSLHIKVDLGKPFKGIVFTKDFSEECRTRGNYTSSVELVIPMSGCGVRAEPRHDEDIEMSVKIVVQMDGKLRQVADVERLAKCTMPTDMMSMDVPSILDKKNVRNGRMRFDAEASTQRVRVWLELGGLGGAGAVEVGQATTLGVRALLPRGIGVRIVDCAALDGLGESSQKLLDDRGCPIDEQVMPALLIRLRPVEEGWSKPHDDDIVEKLFTATFPAFKFPDRERLHVSCGVQLCKGTCPSVDCKTQHPFILSAEKQLARIEVFNSLAVTAPQIELDRLQMQKNGNNSIDNEASVTARHLKSEGTLCMSSSKLALAFCLLGLIFLVAVVVAVVCLLRARVSKARSVRTCGTSIFSSSSSSQSRFGSKLFVPYAGGTLPYGRVY